MDPNILNILKNFSERMHCPGCGKKFMPSEVHFMGQQNGEALLQLKCDQCKMPVWVNVLNGKMNNIEREPDILDLEPITADEIIHFHNQIKVFDGNFKKAFKR
jgi:formate dehydrogenase maturation protein FdhE